MFISMGRGAAVAGIIIVALMIAGTIDVSIDDAWLWSLLSLFVVCFVFGKRRLRPWEQRWWWESED
jgi:hypothetical protein